MPTKLFAPGHAKAGGRAPGTPNANTKALKDMILGALSGVGGEAYLMRQAELNPGPFMTLIGKVLPMSITGGDGGALVIRWEKSEPTDQEPQ